MNCFIGLDLGTSAYKCILISESGAILAHSVAKNSFLHPTPERVEFDVDERYKQICNLIRSVLNNNYSDINVLAICITGASGNALMLDKQKRALVNAVSWMDLRAEATYEEDLVPFKSEYVYSVTGWPKIGSFPLTYFSWMKVNEPEIYNSAEFLATDFIYFNYRLSGSWVHDTSTATNFYLQEQVDLKYHQPFLNFFGIEHDRLPKIVKSGEPIGKITLQASKETGLHESTIVVAGSFDHPSAARGTGMTEIGDLLLSCGTSWVGFFPVTSREKAMELNMLIDPFLSPEGSWGAMFSFSGIGNTLNQYINLLFDGSPDRFAKFDEAAMNSLEAENEFYFDLLQKDLSPKEYLSEKLKSHSIPNICRSIMESMAYLMSSKINYFKDNGMTINNITMVGGFSESQVWPQILSDIIGLPVRLIHGEFAGCFGASILAGIGIGLFRNESDGFNKLNIKYITLKPNSVKIK